MTRFVIPDGVGRGSILLLLGILPLACNRTSAEPAPKTETSAKPASSTPPAASSSASSSATSAEEDDLCKGQPYKRRCDKACKEAQGKALEKACLAETQAFNAWSEASFGKCMMMCRKPGTESTCVGVADKEACECQLKCYRALPKENLDRARAAARCYNQAIAPACE